MWILDDFGNLMFIYPTQNNNNTYLHGNWNSLVTKGNNVCTCYREEGRQTAKHRFSLNRHVSRHFDVKLQHLQFKNIEHHGARKPCTCSCPHLAHKKQWTQPILRCRDQCQRLNCGNKPRGPKGSARKTLAQFHVCDVDAWCVLATWFTHD